MGLIRKVTSATTLGLVDFRSDKERIARNTKKAYKAQQDGNVLAAQQLAAQQAMLQAQLQASMNPAPAAPATPISQRPITAVSAAAQPAELTSGQPPGPGWYADPLGTASERFHDGSSWTNETR